ncbi:MAG: histidinol-phosphate transaminase [Alphaproteobacteria bacterium]
MSTDALDHLVPSHVRRFEAYVPSPPDDVLCRRFGVDRLDRLHNNENPLGPPPAAAAVLREWPREPGIVYPQGDGWHLRHRLAAHFGVGADQVVIGNGACEAIAFVIKAFCEAGDDIITADRTFAVYEWVAEFSGIGVRLVPLADFAYDEAAMLAAIGRRSKVVFLCNPNNPTGSWWSHERLSSFLDAVAGRAIVVADEAYAEFVDDPTFPDSMALLRRHPNLVVFRTFSKAWGLAGLRIGYLIAAPEVAATIRKTAISYSVNALALDAALAAVWDGEHLAATNRLMTEARAIVGATADRLGLRTVGTAGNFVMLEAPMADTALHRRLLGRGIMVRAMTAFRCPGWLRISLSHPEVMDRFAGALEEIIGGG